MGINHYLKNNIYAALRILEIPFPCVTSSNMNFKQVLMVNFMCPLDYVMVPSLVKH